MKGGGIMALFPSEAWLTELADKVNASKEYEEAAAAWEGDLCFVIEAEPDVGIPNDVCAWVDLWRGKCRDFKYGLSAEEGGKAKFVLRAPYARWKQVINQELDPVKGMMSGKLKLKGDIFTMIRHVKAAKAFVVVTGTVQTEFIDEQG
jgi:putative sterol carrier protein